MNAIESQIRNLAADFVERLLDAVRESPLSELASSLPGRAVRTNGLRPGRAGRIERRTNGRTASMSRTAARRRVSGGRRTAEEVAELRSKVVAIVRGMPSGIAIGEIARRLGVNPGDITRPIALAVGSGTLVRKGEKRLARYYAGRRAA